VKAADDKSMKLGLTYVPYQGGGAVATQLVGGHVNSTVNNPIEAASHWKSGAERPPLEAMLGF